MKSEIENLYEKCHQLFRYENGKLFRKISRSPNARIGDEVCSIDYSGCDSGYFRVKIDKKSYLVHRLIYLMHFKEFAEVIDHMDGNTLNNKIENLRPATKMQNRWNCLGNSDSQVPIKGVFVDGKKFKALITVDGNRYYLGMHDTIEEAEKVVVTHYAKLQGEFNKYDSERRNT